ncbi:MAG: GNAT family N-acetyltransferase [Cumulibacter sp.]
MPRGTVLIREAVAADEALVTAIANAEISTDGLLTSGAKLMLESPTGPRPQFGVVLNHPEFRTIVAIDPSDDQVIGLAVMSEDLFSTLIGRPAVYVHYLFVLDERRHRGVGSAMLSDVTRFADELGAESVAIGLWTEARDVNRYFAKLGFTPVVQRRIAPVSTLRRTLGFARPVTSRRRNAQP